LPKKLVLAGLLLAVLASSLTGCWNRRELEEIAFVTAVAVDQAVEAGKIQLTVHIAKPFALAQVGASSAVDEKSTWTEASTGYTSFDAIRNFLSKTPRRLFWAHNRVIILGEDFARSGIASYLDFYTRDSERRLNATLFVVKGERGADMMNAQYGLETYADRGCFGILAAAEEGLSTVVRTDLNEFQQMLATPGWEPTVARLELVPLTDDGLETARATNRINLKRDEITLTVRNSGAAVFKDAHLVGWLDGPETRGLNWVLGDVRSGIIVVPSPIPTAEYFGLEIISSSRKITPQIVNGRPAIKLEVHCNADLGDVKGFVNIPVEPNLWRELEKRLAEAVRLEIRAALAKAQKEFNSDIFGFGAAFYRNLPAIWRQWESRWDEYFPHLPVDIEVKARLLLPGLTQRGFRIE
jgi:spore germination protein KC